jgi:transposase
MSKTKRTFTAEYKAQAVRAWRESGRQLSVFAREIGVSSSMLHRWTQEQSKAQQSAKSGSSAKSEREELLRLRRENEVLKEERDFLRSAAAYFAKERK